MTKTEEHQIIECVLAGDRVAYAVLVDAYKGPIINLAYRMTGNLEDANDLAQDTFVRAYINLKTFRLGQPFFAWLYTIGLNLIRNHLKKHGRVNASETVHQLMSRAGEQDTIPMEQRMIETEEINRLERCLQKLPVDLREALVLRFYQDLAFEEIATISGASVSAVKMRVYRGLEKLKGLMVDE